MTLLMSSSDFPTASLQVALVASAASGTFSDTAYRLFSCHAGPGKARDARAVFGSGRVMKAVSEHLMKQLEASFPDYAATHQGCGDYDYDSDSDLDEDESTENAEDVMSDWNSADLDSDEDEVFEDTEDMGSEISSVSSVSCSTMPSKCINANKVQNIYDSSPDTVSESETFVDYHSANKATYEVFIPNVAARTWRALVCFLYSGKVYFAPLKCLGNVRRLVEEQHSRDFPDGPPICSPKSMYRLAKLAGLDALQDLAQKAIEASLSESCIVDEVFSKFSASHPEILEVQLQYLCSEGRLARVMPRVREFVKAAMRGAMPHAVSAVDFLITRFAGVLSPSDALSGLPSRLEIQSNAETGVAQPPPTSARNSPVKPEDFSPTPTTVSGNIRCDIPALPPPLGTSSKALAHPNTPSLPLARTPADPPNIQTAENGQPISISSLSAPEDTQATGSGHHVPTGTVRDSLSSSHKPAMNLDERFNTIDALHCEHNQILKYCAESCCKERRKELKWQAITDARRERRSS